MSNSRICDGGGCLRQQECVLLHQGVAHDAVVGCRRPDGYRITVVADTEHFVDAAAVDQDRWLGHSQSKYWQ